MGLRKYIGLLFDGWIGRLSSLFTVVSLLMFFLLPNLPPGRLLEIVPRDVLAILAFFSFALANYSIHRQAIPSQPDLQIVDWEEPLLRGGIKFDRSRVFFEKDILIEATCRARISNPGASTSVEASRLDAETYHPPRDG